MNEKMKSVETKKIERLLDAAQQDLDSAKKEKAPQSTVEFLEQRVKALESKIAKWNELSDKQNVESVEEQITENAENEVKKKSKASKR